LRERPIIGPGVGSGLKRPQEIECRFRGNTSLSTPTPTSEVNPTPNPRRPGPDPPSRRLRVDESHAEQSTRVQTLECQTLKVREMFRRSFVTSLLGNRDDQGGFDRRAGAALTASVPIQQDRANSQSNVEASVPTLSSLDAAPRPSTRVHRPSGGERLDKGRRAVWTYQVHGGYNATHE
jgi:hypothetical protein